PLRLWWRVSRSLVLESSSGRLDLARLDSRHTANGAATRIRSELVVASEHLVGWRRPQARPEGAVKTWRYWLGEAYAAAVGGRVPMKSRNRLRRIDWTAVLEGIEGATSVADRQITLDEAQDVPHRLITAMKCYAGNLIAFADPLQRHAEDGSTLDELVDAL